MYARRVAEGAEQPATLERRERAAIVVLADAVEGDVKPARQDPREVFALVVDWRGGEFADQRCVSAARGGYEACSSRANPGPEPSRLFSTTAPRATVWGLANTRNGGAVSSWIVFA